MSLSNVLTLVSQHFIPSAIPAANVYVIKPESIPAGGLPAAVIDQEPRRPSWEYRRPRVTRQQHYVQIEFFMSPALAGGIQQAKTDVLGWVEGSRALVQANRTINDVNGNQQVMYAGMDVKGNAMTWSIDTILDQSGQEPLAYGWLCIPIQELEEVSV